jgi:hypothetical protein
VGPRFSLVLDDHSIAQKLKLRRRFFYAVNVEFKPSLWLRKLRQARNFLQNRPVLPFQNGRSTKTLALFRASVWKVTIIPLFEFNAEGLE